LQTATLFDQHSLQTRRPLGRPSWYMDQDCIANSLQTARRTHTHCKQPSRLPRSCGEILYARLYGIFIESLVSTLKGASAIRMRRQCSHGIATQVTASHLAVSINEVLSTCEEQKSVRVRHSSVALLPRHRKKFAFSPRKPTGEIHTNSGPLPSPPPVPG
jgi:hypothetical protein